MNARILNNLQTWQTHNEEKAIHWMKKKNKAKWDQFQIEVQCLKEVWWLLLVKLTYDKLLQIIGIPMWGVGFIPYNKFSQIEKYNDFTKIIWVNKVGYPKPMNFTWDAYNWNFESTRGHWEKDMQIVCKYHESKMIHDRQVCKHLSFF